MVCYCFNTKSSSSAVLIRSNTSNVAYANLISLSLQCYFYSLWSSSQILRNFNYVGIFYNKLRFFSTGNRNKIIVSVYKSFTTAKHMEVHVAEVISFIGNPVYRKSTQKLNYYIIEWFKIVLSPVKYIMAWYKREWRS